MRDLGIQLKYSRNNGRGGKRRESGLHDPWENARLNYSMRTAPIDCYLRCPDSVLKKLDLRKTVDGNPDLSDPLKDKKEAMKQRLTEGYGLVRYRVQSGEETASVFRGVLIPVRSGQAPDHWPYSSNNGQDFQIFDSKVGLMNVTYSSAWQLGRVRDLGLNLAVSRLT